jgi:hypothetical protein
MSINLGQFVISESMMTTEPTSSLFPATPLLMEKAVEQSLMVRPEYNQPQSQI